MEQACFSARVERAPTQLAQHTVARRSSDLLCAEASDLPRISPMAWVIRSSARCPPAFPYTPYYPLCRDGDVYMTRVQVSSLATRSPFVSEVEVLKHAPGTTSRVFPACNACQNALTLTDSSSALSIAQKPRTGSHSSTAVVSAPPQHQSTLRNEQVQFLYHVLRYQRAMHSPAIHEASGIRYQVSGIRHPASGIRHPASGIRHPASGIRHQASGIRHQASGIRHQASSIRHQASGIRHQASGISFHHLISATSHRGSPLASALSSQYSQVQLLDSCVTVAQRHDGLRSRRHGSVCALPLDWETRHRPRKVIKVRTKTSNPSHPPHPTHHAPPPREPSPTLSGASQDGPSPAGRLRACLPVLNTIWHARNREQPSNPKQSPCPELRETEKESLFHVKQRTKPGTK